MDHALRDVAFLALFLTLGVGPVATLAGLLNRRDRREAALLVHACSAFSGPALRSDVAIRVRCALLSRRAVVTVDMRVWSREEIWEAMTRLRRRLPSSVQLRLDGTMEPALRTRLTVERVDAGGELELTPRAEAGPQGSTVKSAVPTASRSPGSRRPSSSAPAAITAMNTT